MKRISIHIDPMMIDWIDSQTDNRSDFIRWVLFNEYERQRTLNNFKKEKENE